MTTIDFNNYMNDKGKLTINGDRAVAMGLALLVEACGRQQEANGWRESNRPFTEECMLVVTEVAEAVEEYRDHRGFTETYYKPEKPTKPEGIPSELADVIIRVGDMCEKYNIDLADAFFTKFAYNFTRGYKHSNDNNGVGKKA